MSKARDNSASGVKSEIYQRARWKHYLRFVGLLLLVCLNISLVGSSIEVFSTRQSLDLQQQLASYLVAIFFDITVLIPILFEVDRLWFAPDRLILKTLLWEAKIPYEQIVSFSNPIYLAFGIIKTKNCFYLVNKRDISSFPELAQILSQRIGKTGKA
jgi:hypothetical protein